MMKRANLILSVLGIMALLPQAAFAEDKTYLGVAMLNSIYRIGGNDHRSTGLVGRLGYDMYKYLAVETQFGGDIGSQSNVSSDVGQAQISDFYSAFLRFNSRFGTTRMYALGGITYGTRELGASNSPVTIRSSGSNGSYGLGVEAYGNEAVSFQLEWVRYLGNRNYSVDGWNLGLVTRF